MFYRKIIKELEDWRSSSFRKPLIIRGARQVGKTTVVEAFGKQFKQYIYLNLEQNEDRALFDPELTIHEITDRIFIEKGMLRALASSTLLFIDELQEAPHVVNLLRYFKEEVSELPVIAAGSMLETLLGKNITFPVGRVEYKVLRPFSFEEFLMALGREDVFEQIKVTPIKAFAHDISLKLFHTYALIGGMPEIVKQYVELKDVSGLGHIYDSLLSSYLEDAEKYAKSDKQLQLIRFCIQHVIPQAGQRITYQRFGNLNYSSTEVSQVMFALQKTHLIHLLHPVIGYGLPLEQDFKKSPRLQFLDSGMISYFVGLQRDIVGTKDLNTIYEGKLIEHLVGQELLAMQTLSLRSIYFWTREKNQSSAELDFVYPFEGEVVPVEVKSGPSGRLRSLQVFLDQSKINYAIRFYAGKVQIDHLKTQAGKPFYLLSLPYYLVSRIEEYLTWLKEQIHAMETTHTMGFREDPARYSKEVVKRTEKIIGSLDELTSKHLDILNYCKELPRKASEILEDCLGLTCQSRNKKIFVKPLLELGLLDYTDQSYLKSKEQRYLITDKGRTLINKSGQLSLFM